MAIFSKFPLKIPIANNLLFKEPLRFNRKKLCSIKWIPTCRLYLPLLDDTKHDLFLISGLVSAWNILHVTCVAFFRSLDVRHLLILLSLIVNTHTQNCVITFFTEIVVLWLKVWKYNEEFMQIFGFSSLVFWLESINISPLINGLFLASVKSARSLLCSCFCLESNLHSGCSFS